MFKAKLFIFDKDYNVLEFDTDINQKDDGTGLPITRTHGGKLNITMPSPKDISEFFTVAVSSRQMVSGYLRLFERDGLHKHKDWEFANAYVLQYQESFNARDHKPMTCHLVISPGILRVNGLIYENEWNPSNPFKTQATPTTVKKETQEPVALEGYYTTLSGELIPNDELQIGTEVFYVLKTQNAVGQYIDLDFTDEKNDFKYNGKLLVNDILEDFKITADTQKIKLQVIRQTT